MTSPLSRSRLRALLALMVLAALAPIAGLLAWQVYQQVHDEEVRARDELQRSAADFAQAVDRELASSIDALTVLSQSEIFQQGRITAMGRLLHGRPRRDWDSIFLLDPQGGVVLDTATRPAGMDTVHALHAQAMKQLKPVVSGAGRPPNIDIAMPIMQGDRVLYVLGVRTSDAVWPRLAANATPPEGGHASLYDSQGRLVAQSRGATSDVKLEARELQAMAQQSSGIARTLEAEGEVYAAWSRVPLAGWHARVSVPSEPLDAARRERVMRALSTSGVALLAGLLLSAAIAIVIARRWQAD